MLSTWFLCDALLIWTKLSKFFQRANLNVADVGPMVTASRQALLSMKDVPGTYLSEVLDKREDNLVRTSASYGHFVDVPVPDRLLDSFHTARKQFLQAVMDNLAMRFPDMELVDSLSVLDPRNLPPVWDEALDSYGNRQIQLLADHFSEKAVGGDIQPEPGLVEKEEALAEWSLLRSLMSTAY